MSVRIRIILAISLINLFIVLFSVFSGIAYVRKNTEKSMETDMMVVADIADHFISAEIEVLKLKASDIAGTLSRAKEADWQGILSQVDPLYPEFPGMAVFDKSWGLIASQGEQPASVELLEEEFIQRAFSGNTVFSTTIPSLNGVVFYLTLPVPETKQCVLSITIPGMYFSERVASFVIWETGHIFIDDAQGHVIANIRENWVQNRFNFIKLAETDKQYEEVAAIIQRVISGEQGVGYFTLAGAPRLCSFRPVSASEEGWSLGVIAPLPESPLRNLDKGLLLVGLVSFFMGTLAAIIASNFLKKPFEEVAALKEAAEANSISKSKFLANMSHEMRTPLNAVIGLSELTLDGNIHGEEKENIQKVYTAGVTLLNIINDILDISKIESGKFELNPVEYEVPSLINDTVTLNIMRIEDKPVKFKLFVDETLPFRLYGDDLRIKQIFNNLLSNAFKYTKAGIVEWHILWEKSGTDAWLISSIKDSGIGIRKEDIEKLFKNYTQVDTSANRHIEGTGLGLALTKFMVELMDGNITVDSEYGKGSTFTFRIKQGFVADTPIGSKIAESLRNFTFIDQKQNRNSRLVRLHLPYARVLVVDDVATNLAVVKGIMKPYGMKVECVSSGIEAIELIRRGEIYSAIFMDHMMPEMNGLEAVSIIRNDIDSKYAKTVPIIALTANAIRGSEEIFLASGFQDFLSKPIDINQMDAIIRKWVRDREHERHSGGANEIAVQDDKRLEHGIEGIDLEKALAQFGSDMDTLIIVLKTYAEQMPSMLDSIRSVDSGNLTAYVTVVHGIKGSSRGIHANIIGDFAEKLELAGMESDVSFINNNNGAFICEVEKLINAIKVWLAHKPD